MPRAKAGVGAGADPPGSGSGQKAAPWRHWLRNPGHKTIRRRYTDQSAPAPAPYRKVLQNFKIVMKTHSTQRRMLLCDIHFDN